MKRIISLDRVERALEDAQANPDREMGNVPALDADARILATVAGKMREALKWAVWGGVSEDDCIMLLRALHAEELAKSSTPLTPETMSAVDITPRSRHP